jgi:hypothetical protein
MRKTVVHPALAAGRQLGTGIKTVYRGVPRCGAGAARASPRLVRRRWSPAQPSRLGWRLATAHGAGMATPPGANRPPTSPVPARLPAL